MTIKGISQSQVRLKYLFFSQLLFTFFQLFLFWSCEFVAKARWLFFFPPPPAIAPNPCRKSSEKRWPKKKRQTIHGKAAKGRFKWDAECLEVFALIPLNWQFRKESPPCATKMRVRVPESRWAAVFGQAKPLGQQLDYPTIVSKWPAE